MAETDNGLPSNNSNLNGKQISHLNIHKKEYTNEVNNQGIHAVSIQKQEVTETQTPAIHAVSIQKQEVTETQTSAIHAVNLQTRIPKTDIIGINNINFATKPSPGNNIVLFYL